jgi:transposase-like protein
MASKREERHQMYFKIGAMACERNPEQDSLEHWKKILGYHGYSDRSLRQWMRWHRCLGEYADLAAPLMSEVISTLCAGTYMQEVRVEALHAMVELNTTHLSSKQASLHARAYLQAALMKSQEQAVTQDFPPGVERYLDILLIKLVTHLKNYLKGVL